MCSVVRADRRLSSAAARSFAAIHFSLSSFGDLTPSVVRSPIVVWQNAATFAENSTTFARKLGRKNENLGAFLHRHAPGVDKVGASGVFLGARCRALRWQKGNFGGDGRGGATGESEAAFYVANARRNI